MKTNLLLFLIFLFIVLLLLLYYINLNSNIIVLLSIVLILLVNNLIINKEYFQTKKYCLIENTDKDSEKCKNYMNIANMSDKEKSCNSDKLCEFKLDKLNNPECFKKKIRVCTNNEKDEENKYLTYKFNCPVDNKKPSKQNYMGVDIPIEESLKDYYKYKFLDLSGL